MASYDLARRLVATHFPELQLQPQPLHDWNGPFPLADAVRTYYHVFGATNSEIEGYGNSYFLPQLATLWSFQAGYRYHGVTHDVLLDWNDDWLVIADAGGDTFICSQTDDRVAYAYHGAGSWKPDWLFDNLEQMVTCLLTVSSVQRVAGDDFLNDESLIKPTYYRAARQQLSAVLLSMQAADRVLATFEWTMES